MKNRRIVTLTLGLAVVLGAFTGPVAAQASPYNDRTSVGVVAGKASCTVSWTREYWGGSVITYRVWVVPQDLAPGASSVYRKITVSPQNPGVTKSVKIGSLTKGSAYVFWLETVFQGYIRAAQVSVQQGTSRGCVPL